MPATAPDKPFSLRRARTPTVIQMEAVECGAAALSIVLGYHGRRVPLSELRLACGVSRDGSKASNIIRAARKYGLEAEGWRKSLASLGDLDAPFIVFWKFNHFLVVEGEKGDKVYLNDPACGPRTVSREEFDHGYTGVVLTFSPTETFQPGGSQPGILQALWARLKNDTNTLAYVLLASVGLMLTGLAIPLFSQFFVDEILMQGNDQWVWPLLCGMGLALVMQFYLGGLKNYALLRLQGKMELLFTSRFFWHVLRLPQQFFSQRHGGEIASRVSYNRSVASVLSQQLAGTLLNLMVVGFYLILMLQYDVLMTLFGVLFALLNVAFMRWVARQRSDMKQRVMQEYGKLVSTSVGGLQMIETIKATAGEPDFLARWSGHQANVLNAEQKLGRSLQLFSVVPTMLTGAAMGLVLCVGALRVIQGQMTVGMLVAFQALLMSFLRPVEELVSMTATFQDTQSELNRLDDVLSHETDEALNAREDSTPAGAPRIWTRQARLAGHVELRDVTFGYSALEAPLVENINIDVPAGSWVALVGASGSGKSTLSRLISGLYTPWSGEILFDGMPRQAIPRDVLADSLSLVDQDITMFVGTIRENLSMWDPQLPEADILRAAHDADIHAAIAARTGAYASQIEEGGRNFSGGERQRLEIARALVRNPRILLLDEATSALDPIVEKRIGDRIRRRGCTCILIAHRLSTIRDADEIIVLTRGRIVERGTHEQLLAAGGAYAALVAQDRPQEVAHA